MRLVTSLASADMEPDLGGVASAAVRTCLMRLVHAWFWLAVPDSVDPHLHRHVEAIAAVQRQEGTGLSVLMKRQVGSHVLVAPFALPLAKVVLIWAKDAKWWREVVRVAGTASRALC